MASTLTRGQRASRRSTNGATPSERCSQLSSTSRAWRSARAASTDSSMLRPCCSPKAERGRYRGADHRRIGDRHEVDEPHAVVEVAGQVRGDGQRQSGLAHAAGADGGDLAVRPDGVAQFGALLGSADERVQRRREARPAPGWSARPGPARPRGRRAPDDPGPQACAAARTRGSRPCAPRCTAAHRSRRCCGAPRPGSGSRPREPRSPPGPSASTRAPFSRTGRVAGSATATW